jgi:hypothetical protein
MAMNLFITFSMPLVLEFMLSACKSVESESGRKPALMSGIATRKRKLPPPVPASK